MKKLLIVACLIVSVFLSGCNAGERVTTALKGNGNGCSVTACTEKPVKCTYNILTGKCE